MFKPNQSIAILAMFLTAAPALAAPRPYTTGLTLWLQADKGLSPDGSTWLDQSKSGLVATAVAGGPAVTAGAIKGLPEVKFSGQALALNGAPISGQQFTVIALVSDATTRKGNTGFREIFSNWDLSNEQTSVFLGTTGFNPVAVRFTDDIGGATDPNHTQTGVGAVKRETRSFVLAGVNSATDAVVYLNGAVLYDKGAPVAPRAFGTGFYIGEQGSSPNEFWDGAIEEIMVYNSALTAAQIAQDTKYLKAKYGIGTVVP